jgi:hypothetical protein
MARDKENAKRLSREWYLKNKELTKSRAAAWVFNNPERRKEICAANRKKHGEERNTYSREWFANNKHKRASYQRKRDAALKNRVPPWLSKDDLWMMDEAYDIAQIRSKLTGFQWHVDHIIPLQGKKVSGLHVPWNLQVIPWFENCRKNAKFENA